MPSSKRKLLSAYPISYFHAAKELIRLGPQSIDKVVEVVHEGKICTKAEHDTRRRKLATFINACYAPITVISVVAASLQELRKYHGIELRVKSTYDSWKRESMIGLTFGYTKEEQQRRLAKQLVEEAPQGKGDS